MIHIKEFDKNAKTYDRYNIIQRTVANELVQKTNRSPKKIVDLGCGSGVLYNAINWQLNEFIAVDKSQQMLDLHPQTNVTKLCVDIQKFDFANYSDHFFFSSSALQWCKDLNAVFKQLQQKDFALALFSANTFKSLHQKAQTISPIATQQQIIDAAKSCLDTANVEIKEYRLKFNSTLDMLRYIKRSGVSGGKKLLSYKQTKTLLREYDKDYLEFEVVFISS